MVINLTMALAVEYVWLSNCCCVTSKLYLSWAEKN